MVTAWFTTPPHQMIEHLRTDDSAGGLHARLLGPKDPLLPGRHFHTRGSWELLSGILRSEQARASCRILRTTDAARYIGLSKSSLEKMRLAGDGPAFVRLRGRAVGYDIQDLNSWIERQRATCGSRRDDD